jgi:putative peptidoglycan lipid II flippase
MTVVADSLRVATWTGVSRVTGLGRAVAVAAVLGPTYIGSLFQAVYVLPALIYQMLVGSLIVSLLVPALVPALDANRPREAQRIAGGFMTVACVVFAAAAALAVVAAPLLLSAFTAGVADPAAGAEQRRAGVLLIALMMPQVVLLGIAGAGAAVLNARGRFRLAAGAPALENAGVIVLMAATAALPGTPHDELLLLGLGATAAVSLHAAAVWWGARRAGVTLLPRAGWRDPDVRPILKRAVPSLGTAGLDAVRQLAVLPIANRVPGGVVAFQLAVNFVNLPVALAAKPVATALVPRLARLFEARRFAALRDECVRGLRLAALVTLPVAAGYVLLAEPLSEAVAHGEMATPAGVAAVAACLVALAPGIVGESGFHVTAHAFLAIGDARSPLVAGAVRTMVVLAGIVVAAAMTPGTAMLVALGLAVSAGHLAGAWVLGRRRRALFRSLREPALAS